MNTQQETTQPQPTSLPPEGEQPPAPLIIFQLCQSCTKNDVCEIWKAAVRLKQSIQGITQQYRVELSGDNIEVISCEHGHWDTGQEVKV